MSRACVSRCKVLLNILEKCSTPPCTLSQHSGSRCPYIRAYLHFTRAKARSEGSSYATFSSYRSPAPSYSNEVASG